MTRRRKATGTERSFAIAELLLVRVQIHHVERNSDSPNTFSSTPIFSPPGVVMSYRPPTPSATAP